MEILLCIVKCLFGYGADIDAKNKDNNTPLDLSIKEKNDKISTYLLEKRMERLHDAIENQDSEDSWYIFLAAS